MQRAAVLIAAALAVASGLAISELRAIAVPAVVEIAVPPQAVHADGERLRGELLEGLPPYELHWDGQPPSAVLVNRQDGRVLAASTFSDDSFSRNRNAVRFTDGRVRFVVDGRRGSAASGSFVVRCEAVAPRWRYTLAALAAVVLALALVVVLGLKSYLGTPLSGRPAARRRLAEGAIFIAIAAVVFAGIYPGAPIRVEEVTDEANINSFAAALDHPDRFALDKLLADPAHYAWYTPVYINTIRVFGRAGYHYATANAFLGAATALLLLFGFRRMFMAISGHRDFAFAAALALGLMFDQRMPPPGETWSILSVLPRMVFTACLPWVMLLAFWCAPSSRRWWVACGAAGLLMHIHPLSAPALEGALLIGFIAASDEPWAARIGGAATATIAAFATMGPYVLIFTTRYRGTVAIDPAIAARSLELVRATFAELSTGRVLRELLVHRVMSLRILLDALAVALLVRQRVDRSMRFYLGILAGFAIVTFAVPAADSAIANYLGRRPYEYEMIRNVRFMDVLVAAALGLAVSKWQGTPQRRRAWVAAGAICTVFALGPGWFETAWAMAGRARLSWRILHGRSDTESGAAQEAIRAMQALRASGERVSGPVGLRQFDVPLAFVPKDVIGLTYSTGSALVESVDAVNRAQPLFAASITDESLAQLSSVLDAQLFLLRRRQLDPSLARSPRVLFENSVYAIVTAGVQ